MVFSFHPSHIAKQASAKKEWAVCAVLSLIYFILFALIAQGVITNNLLFGFCVWGQPKTPDEEYGCKHSHPLNSHLFCFMIGMTAFAIEIVLYFMDPNIGKSQTRVTTYYVLMFIVSVHGLLHWFLQQVDVGDNILGTGLSIIIDCYRDFSEHDFFVNLGMFVFGLWSFALAVAILRLGAGEFTRQNTVISIVLTLIVLGITWKTGLELILPALFVMTHVLVSVIGLLTETPTVPEDSTWIFESVLVGSCFIFATGVAILEMVVCPEVMKPIGGHMWYDIGLASVAVTAAPYFSFPKYGKKKE